MSFSGAHQTKRASGRAQVPEALARTILENLVPSSVLRPRRLNEKAPRKSGSGLLGHPIATDGKRWFPLLIGTSAPPAETKTPPEAWEPWLTCLARRFRGPMALQLFPRLAASVRVRNDATGLGQRDWLCHAWAAAMAARTCSVVGPDPGPSSSATSCLPASDRAGRRASSPHHLGRPREPLVLRSARVGQPREHPPPEVVRPSWTGGIRPVTGKRSLVECCMFLLPDHGPAWQNARSGSLQAERRPGMFRVSPSNPKSAPSGRANGTPYALHGASPVLLVGVGPSQ